MSKVHDLRERLAAAGVQMSESVEWREGVAVAGAGSAREERMAPEGSPEAPLSLRLRSGRRAVFSGGRDEDRMVVTAADGQVELSVCFTERGPVLRFEGAALRFETPGELSFDCEKLKLNAADSLELSAGGKMKAEAHSVDVRSRLGNVNLKANDDVRLLGERIKLNC